MVRRAGMWMALVAGCSSRPVPPPVPTVAPVAAEPDAGTDAPPAPRYLIGESCLNKRLSQTHLFPRFLGGGGAWQGDAYDVGAPLREAPQHFTVFGFDGTEHGEMVTDAGAVGPDPRGFLGTYTGPLGVCNFRRDGTRGSMADCVDAGGCGLAIAIVGDTNPPPAPPGVSVATTCIADGRLIADLDRDGNLAAFPLAAFRDRPEIDGVPHTGPACPPRFTWFATALGADLLDVLGAGDFDQDGALELVIAIRSGTSRTVAMYGTVEGSNRLRRLALVSR